MLRIIELSPHGVTRHSSSRWRRSRLALSTRQGPEARPSGADSRQLSRAPGVHDRVPLPVTRQCWAPWECVTPLSLPAPGESTLLTRNIMLQGIQSWTAAHARVSGSWGLLLGNLLIGASDTPEVDSGGRVAPIARDDGAGRLVALTLED